MADKANIEERIKKATEFKQLLEIQLEKVKGTPREEEYQLMIDELDDLIADLNDDLKAMGYYFTN